MKRMTPAERALAARLLSAVKRWWLTAPGSPQEHQHAEQVVDAVENFMAGTEKQ